LPEAPEGPVTVVDANGAQVTVQRPVTRIVCLTSAETVYALGAGSRIVGIAGMLTTDVKAVLPDSILSLPVVGDTDAVPNVEKILELNPDVILASQRLSDENRKRFENAGIAVLEDTTTGDRRNQYLTNLGLILNTQQRAEEIIAYEAHYWQLVQDRVANLPRSQKPVVYFEWYREWFSTGPGGSYTGLIEAAGGINVGENTSISSPQLSSEFVLAQNPDFIIRMLDYTSGETQSSFQNLYNGITSRTGVSDLNAAKNNHIYVIKSTLLVERDVIGLLYFAKWFHPDLFSDIDPAAVHAEMIQKYFGTTVSGLYLYP
jgi:iron complex transport system substrate-binding protein